jgi:site-specific DNA-methyltransferase (cytosine-N4-specific)
MTARFLVGDVHQGLATLPDDSVDLVFTSPPFLALRSYLPADHPAKSKEIGSEPTPADFLDTLLDVVEACDRVLAPHGTLCFELGDTYAGSGGAGGDYDDDGWRDGQERFNGSARRSRRGWPESKSLCFIPELFGASLAYGRNLLRPERETPPWRIRNFTVWHRPNPPVGALGDKWRPSCSFVTVACKSRTRWFDLDAVRHEHIGGPHAVGSAMVSGEPRGETMGASNPAGAPPLDCLILPTEPYPGSHYAVMPRRLVEPFVLSMCPVKVCRECGEPSRRIVDLAAGMGGYHQANDGGTSTPRIGLPMGVGGRGRTERVVLQSEWTDCGHDAWRTGVTLDPFAGSGTTLEVAHGNGRHAIGIDLDERNSELARDRLGMFLDVEVLALDLETSA